MQGKLRKQKLTCTKNLQMVIISWCWRVSSKTYKGNKKQNLLVLHKSKWHEKSSVQRTSDGLKLEKCIKQWSFFILYTKRENPVGLWQLDEESVSNSSSTLIGSVHLQVRQCTDYIVVIAAVNLYLCTQTSYDESSNFEESILQILSQKWEFHSPENAHTFIIDDFWLQVLSFYLLFP